NRDVMTSPADWVSLGPTKADDFKSDPPPADGKKVSLLDTDHLWGIGGDGTWVWKAFTRGHNPLYMDPLTSVMKFPASRKSDPPGAADVRRAMGQTRRYAERVNLAAMMPRPDLASSKYCLANPGTAYLMYLPAGGSVTVDLSSAQGEWTVEWSDPARDES